MPVTAKLSREFYDRFGDKVVDELVGLLNDMDAAFRAELRELNEENFRRFEAKLEQRVSELGSELRVEIAALRTDMADLKAELIKWMFLFWLGTVATMLGLGRFLLPFSALLEVASPRSNCCNLPGTTTAQADSHRWTTPKTRPILGCRGFEFLSRQARHEHGAFDA